MMIRYVFLWIDEPNPWASGNSIFGAMKLRSRQLTGEVFSWSSQIKFLAQFLKSQVSQCCHVHCLLALEVKTLSYIYSYRSVDFLLWCEKKNQNYLFIYLLTYWRYQKHPFILQRKKKGLHFFFLKSQIAAGPGLIALSLVLTLV